MTISRYIEGWGTVYCTGEEGHVYITDAGVCSNRPDGHLYPWPWDQQ